MTDDELERRLAAILRIMDGLTHEEKAVLLRKALEESRTTLV